jgi:hypothetical protein
MNEQAQQLILQLAEQLGVTTELLWITIVNQAKVAVLQNTFCVFAMLTLLTVLGILIKKNTTVPKATEDNRYPKANWGGESGALATGIWFGMVLIFFLICILSVTDSITAILNPEFWALDYILNKIK